MGSTVRKSAQTPWRDICKIALVQLLARFLWIAPLFLPLPLILRIFWMILFGLFAILPLRSLAACQMRNTKGGLSLRPASYVRRVACGTLRVLLDGLWCLPLGGMLFLLYRYIFVLDASRYAKDAILLGSYLAVGAAETTQQLVGLLLVAAAFLISAALSAYGGRRHMLAEYLLTGDALPVPTLRSARIAQKACRQAMLKTMGLNLLSLLPAILLPLAFYCWRCGGVQNMLMSLFLLISSRLVMDPVALWITAGLFLCLYLPLIPFRKGRYAALVNEYER